MNKEECYLCGKIFTSRRDRTKDHVPPKHLYIEHNKPKNLKTLRACLECNNKYSLDEEYFLDLMIITNAYRNPVAKKKFSERLKIIQSRPNYHQRFKKALKIDDLSSPGGIYLGQVHSMSIEPERRKIVTEKIIKGLHYLKYQERLTESSIKLYFPQDLYKSSKISSLMPQSILKDPNVQRAMDIIYHHPFKIASTKDIFNAFVFRGEKDGNLITTWGLTFYNYNLSLGFINTTNGI